MPGEPILTKAHADPSRDYKPMTWERFLLLRAWARYVAWREGCTVAMVGSVLEKEIPRDIDVALIWPADKFREMFGTTNHDEMGRVPPEKRRAFQGKWSALLFSGQKLIEFDTRIDVKLCPDTWWPEKNRLILAEPGGEEPPNSWNGVEFTVPEVVWAGDVTG